MTGHQIAALASAGLCLLLAAVLVVVELTSTRRKDRPTVFLWAALVCDMLALIPTGWLVVSS